MLIPCQGNDNWYVLQQESIRFFIKICLFFFMYTVQYACHALYVPHAPHVLSGDKILHGFNAWQNLIRLVR